MEGRALPPGYYVPLLPQNSANLRKIIPPHQPPQPQPPPHMPPQMPQQMPQQMSPQMPPQTLPQTIPQAIHPAPPPQPSYGLPHHSDDQRQFMMNRELQNQPPEPTKLAERDEPKRNDHDEREGFYCGDAIMFYPDTPECNGSSSKSPKKSSKKKKKAKEEGKEREPTRPHKCYQCTASFKQRGHLIAHIRTHTGEKPFGCNLCGKTFSRVDSANRHVKMHNSKEGKATVINMSASPSATEEEPQERSSRGASYHTSPLESIPPPQFNPFLNIPNTDEMTPSFIPPLKLKLKKDKKKKKKKKSKKHKREKVEKERPHKCPYCNLDFRQLCHLQVHEKIHTGERPFVCDVCSQTFGRKFSALRHMRMMHDDPTGSKLITLDKKDMPPPPLPVIYARPSTSRSSSSRSPEGSHKTEPKKRSYPKRFRCDRCAATFSQQSHLRNHLLTHTGEKPYNCDVCGKAFNRKYSVERHLRTHAGEKKFKCDFCGNLYNQKFQLDDHMRMHTGENDLFDFPHEPDLDLKSE